MKIQWTVEAGTGSYREGCAVIEKNGILAVCDIRDAASAVQHDRFPRKHFRILRHTSLTTILIDHFDPDIFYAYAADKQRRDRKLRRSLVRTARRSKIIKEITQ